MNDVTIKVKAKDETDFGGIKRNAKGQFAKAGDEASKAFTESTRRGSKDTESEYGKSGERSGNSFLSSVKKWFGRAESEGKSSGDKSGKGFGASIQKWFTGDGSKLFGKGGQIGGEAFSSGFTGILKTPILGPAVAGILAVVLATVMPAVGAIAGGALVAGFGAGIAGLGIVMAAKSEAVKSAWSKTMGQIGADMQLISKPFESTLIGIAGVFQRTVDAFNPYLAKAFAKMAGPIGDFADEAGTALEGLIPMIGPVTDAFDEVLKALGPALKSAVGDLSGGMTDLANSVSKNPQALADMVTGLGDIVRESLDLITTLNNVNTSFSDMTGGVSLVEVALAAVGALLVPLSVTFGALGKGIDLVNAALGRNGSNTAEVGQSMSDAASKVADLANKHEDLAGAAKGTVAPLDAVAKAAAQQKKDIADAKAEFEGYISSLFRSQSLSLSLSGAQIALQAAFDDASSAIKENGHQHDINTAKGRANKSALDGVASAANAQTEAMLRSGQGTASAAKTVEASRAKFIALAEKMGYNAGQAKAMAAAMIAIPNVTREAKLQANKTDLENKLAAARKALADPKLTATKKAKLEATISSLLTQVQTAQNKIDALHGKTVGVTVKYSTTGVNLTNPSSVGRRQTGGSFVGYAGGGSPRANSFLAGEDGPEIIEMSGGSARVTPSANTRREMRQAGGGVQKVVLEWASGGGGRLEDLLMKMFRDYVKVRGGNVQDAVGSR